MALSLSPILSSGLRRDADPWGVASKLPMTRRVSRDAIEGFPFEACEDEGGIFGEKALPFVEGEIHVLARCRGLFEATLAWRPAFFSVDLKDGFLRIFRSDEDRRAWHAHGGENLAKWAGLIDGSHVVAAVEAAPDADGGASGHRRRTTARHVRALSAVHESDEEAADDEAADAGSASPLGSSLEDAAAHEGSLRLRAAAADAGGADFDRDGDRCHNRYCTFEIFKRRGRDAPAPVNDAQATGPPLLKFAAGPQGKRDLDVLHDALEAIALTSVTHVVEP